MWENKICKGANVAVQKMEAELSDAIKLCSILILPVLQTEEKNKTFKMQNKAGKVTKI